MEKEKPDEESRPGRIDIRAEIGNPPREGRLAVALRVLQDLEAAERVADHTEGRSIAQVQEICYRMAVEK
jgi:ATP-dependent 26S proteasome regulatory subunit